ncbi:MAG: TSUP family transporter [Pseudomonadota bacterium]
MADALAPVLALTGGAGALALLMAVMAAAGLVRGFTGFGTALIFMPVAGGLIDPGIAVLVLVISGIAVWPVLLPRAWGQGARGEIAVMGVAAIVLAPAGVALLDIVSQDALRWVIAAVAGVTLAALVSGWRYRQRVGWPGLAGVGAAAGLIGGATGIGGPPAILFYLAGPSGADRVRANTILFLCMLDIVILTNLAIQREITGAQLALCALLALPYCTTTLIGQGLFHPERERAFRAVAYVLIALAVTAGLPIWG